MADFCCVRQIINQAKLTLQFIVNYSIFVSSPFKYKTIEDGNRILTVAHNSVTKQVAQLVS